ncbi:HAD family phosphatase [Clostridium acetireducens]|uniref:HAD family hydrolase n=1 Tax=Clostridium acetireducens TaxID=76489 RepID=UPI00311A0BF7
MIKLLSNINAAIFDLDGTLIDSLWIWNEIDKQYLKNHNINMPKNLMKNIENLSFDESAQYFKKNFNIKDDICTIKNDWNTMALNYYSNKIKLKPGAKEFLILLKSKGIKLGLSTSNFSNLSNAVLKSNNIYNLFDAITTADEISKNKNSPDIYLLTAKKLKENPKNCIVFEDILSGIISAKSAGMKVVAVHDIFSESHKNSIMKVADKYILEFNDIMKAI